MCFNLILNFYRCKPLLLFCSLPLVKNVPKRVQILFFRIARGVCVLLVSKVAFALGYVLMEDLSHALSQFYPSSSGGMSGGPSTPPVPSGDSSLVPINENNEDQPGPSASSKQKNHIADLKNDPYLARAYKNALIKQEEIILVMTQLVEKLGIQIADPGDIRKGVDIFLTDIMERDPTYRNKKLKTILKSLTEDHGDSKFFTGIINAINDLT